MVPEAIPAGSPQASLVLTLALDAASTPQRRARREPSDQSRRCLMISSGG